MKNFLKKHTRTKLKNSIAAKGDMIQINPENSVTKEWGKGT